MSQGSGEQSDGMAAGDEQSRGPVGKGCTNSAAMRSLEGHAGSDRLGGGGFDD